MHAAELPMRAPAQPRRATTIAAIAAAITTAVLVLAGALALAANTLRDRDGYFSWPSETYGSDGDAVAMKAVDISDAPKWVFGRAGLDSIRVEAHGNRRLFIGIARAGDIDRYLRGTEHDDVSSLSYHPFQVAYDHTEGGAVPAAPARESFWVESTSGAGDVELRWKLRPGNWRAVVMNADGSRGVSAELRFGARTSMLWWLGGGLLGAAAVVAAAAVVLRRRARA